MNTVLVAMFVIGAVVVFANALVASARQSHARDADIKREMKTTAKRVVRRIDAERRERRIKQ